MPQGETVEIRVGNWTLASGTLPGERQVAEIGARHFNAAVSAPSADMTAPLPPQTTAGETQQE
jgi:hypothetical protein